MTLITQLCNTDLHPHLCRKNHARLEVHAFCGTGVKNITPTCLQCEPGNYYSEASASPGFMLGLVLVPSPVMLQRFNFLYVHEVSSNTIGLKTFVHTSMNEKCSSGKSALGILYT